MNWYFITILILSGLGLIGTLFDKKLKTKKKVAGLIGYIIFMILIALAIRSGW